MTDGKQIGKHRKTHRTYESGQAASACGASPLLLAQIGDVKLSLGGATEPVLRPRAAWVRRLGARSRTSATHGAWTGVAVAAHPGPERDPGGVVGIGTGRAIPGAVVVQ
jgi:hypothetical protein